MIKVLYLRELDSDVWTGRRPIEWGFNLEKVFSLLRTSRSINEDRTEKTITDVIQRILKSE